MELCVTQVVKQATLQPASLPSPSLLLVSHTYSPPMVLACPRLLPMSCTVSLQQLYLVDVLSCCQWMLTSSALQQLCIHR